MATLYCDLCSNGSSRTDVFVTIKQGDDPILAYCSRACAIHALVRDLSLDLARVAEERNEAWGIHALIPKGVEK